MWECCRNQVGGQGDVAVLGHSGVTMGVSASVPTSGVRNSLVSKPSRAAVAVQQRVVALNQKLSLTRKQRKPPGPKKPEMSSSKKPRLSQVQAPKGGVVKALCLPVVSHFERRERQFCRFLRGRVDALIEARTMEGPVACGLPIVQNVVGDGRG